MNWFSDIIDWSWTISLIAAASAFAVRAIQRDRKLDYERIRQLERELGMELSPRPEQPAPPKGPGGGTRFNLGRGCHDDDRTVSS